MKTLFFGVTGSLACVGIMVEAAFGAVSEYILAWFGRRRLKRLARQVRRRHRRYGRRSM